MTTTPEVDVVIVRGFSNATQGHDPLLVKFENEIREKLAHGFQRLEPMQLVPARDSQLPIALFQVMTKMRNYNTFTCKHCQWSGAIVGDPALWSHCPGCGQK